MSLSVKGRITSILDVESGTSKAGKEWKKQSFVIDNGDQYNPNICFSLFGEEKIAMLNNFANGQEVEVGFNLSSREYNGKWYHNIDAWKITADSGTTNTAAPAPAIENAPAEDDDLPF